MSRNKLITGGYLAIWCLVIGILTVLYLNTINGVIEFF